MNHEPDLTAALNEQAERQRRRQRRKTRDMWRDFHEQLAADMHRVAEERQARADALNDVEDAST